MEKNAEREILGTICWTLTRMMKRKERTVHYFPTKANYFSIFNTHYDFCLYLQREKGVLKTIPDKKKQTNMNNFWNGECRK